MVFFFVVVLFLTNFTFHQYKYKLVSADGSEGISDARVGPRTTLTVKGEEGNTLFVVSQDDQKLVSERGVDEALIRYAILTTDVSATDVEIPDACGDAANNAEAAEEGNVEMDADPK